MNDSTPFSPIALVGTIALLAAYAVAAWCVASGIAGNARKSSRLVNSSVYGLYGFAALIEQVGDLRGRAALACVLKCCPEGAPIKIARDLPADCQGNRAGFFRYDDGDGIRFLRNADGCTVSSAQLFAEIRIEGQR